MRVLLLFFLFSVFRLHILANSSMSSTINDDILGLIVFKADLIDPLSKLASWNEDDDNPCKWTGIKCDPKTTHVSELSLSGFSLSGKIGRGLLQLQALQSLSLSNNNFSGTLNSDLVQLERLRNLDLSENSLSGSIPEEFFLQCRTIRSILLAKNAFDGVIPFNIGSCKSLTSLNLSSNRLTGSLPSGIWSLNALRGLDLSDNCLMGEIPAGIGKMYNLRWLSLRGNQFSEKLPDDLGQCLLLKYIDLSGNSLTGNIPDSMRRLSMCGYLSLSWNSLSGELPFWIGDLKSLQTLDLSGNGFSGQLPGTIGSLQFLKELKVSKNAFTGSLPSWIFYSGLTGVSISENKISGFLEIPKISAPTLQMLDLSGNSLSGGIPVDISSISSLQFLNFSSNSFSGDIPKTIGELKSVEFLDISRNQLNGSIPEEISGAVALRELNLEKNSLTGVIPTQIGNCSSLTTLDLSENNLTGQIPLTLANLTNIETINLSQNRLSGMLPKSLSNLPHLLSLNISHNHLSGALPSGNFFNTISPSALCGNPDLCGSAVNRSCPAVLPKPIVLNPNSSSSPIPSSHSAFPIASHKKIILSISALVAISAAIVITIGVITITVLNLRVRASAAAAASNSAPAALEFSDEYLSGSPTTDANSGKLVMFSGVAPEFSAGAHTLLNKDCELGCGGFGAVYKTNLPDGRPVAIKKLTVSSLFKSLEDFEREVRKLGKVRHPNLVALHGYYWTPSLHLLIYEFVPGGSLQKHLHDSSCPLLWQERFDIILGTSRSLAHLHQLDIIHYNLKSSNVLIDGYGEPKVADFGLAKLLPMLDRYVLSSKMQSSLGYMAPEFRCGSVKLTEKCDVYGFGVLMLEIVTGRRPVEYTEDDVVVLCDVVRGALEEGRVEAVVDERLGGKFPVDEAVPVVRLGLICTSQVPSNRPDMGDVVNILEAIRCPRNITEEELS